MILKYFNTNHCLKRFFPPEQLMLGMSCTYLYPKNDRTYCIMKKDPIIRRMTFLHQLFIVIDYSAIFTDCLIVDEILPLSISSYNAIILSRSTNQMLTYMSSIYAINTQPFQPIPLTLLHFSIENDRLRLERAYVSSFPYTQIYHLFSYLQRMHKSPTADELPSFWIEFL